MRPFDVVGGMDLDGWHPDPFGIHEERLFKGGEPTPLVRDDGIGSIDAVPVTGEHPWAGRRTPSARRSRRRSNLPLFPVAGLLIAVGLLVGLIGLVGGGGSGGTASPTTLNSLSREFLTLPPATTISPLERALRALPPTTVLTPLERELQALPRTTTPAPTTPPPTNPRPTTPVTTGTNPARSLATGTTQSPARPPSPPPTSIVVPTTALPLTTMTTSVGQADQTWYLEYGSVFNVLQTEVEKLDRALGATSPTLYSTVHPYWQELGVDVGYAQSLPPIPDASTQSEWAAALASLSKGASQSIDGTPDSGPMDQATFEQGSALITTGTTQMDGALSSVQQLSAATSAASRDQVRSWYQAHSATLKALQTDVSGLNASFSSTSAANYSTLDPSWQQLAADARSAMALPPIPDPLIQAYWSTALGDLVDGPTDCIGTSEALPPNLFDQGVALIASGSSYLSTAAQAVQGLIG
jgi:hypothetical protein